MTDTDSTFCTEEVWPDTADPVDHALAQLREPHHLLAEALLIIRAAQATGVEMDQHMGDLDEDGERSIAYFDRVDRHRRLLDEAAAFTQVAKVAVELATVERTAHPLTDADLDVMAEQPSPNFPQPQAVNGVRFTCTIYGQFLGRVGGRKWLWADELGYLDVTHAEAVGVPDADGQCDARFSGTVKSAAGEHALCVTDGGDGVTLPRILFDERPDE